MDGFETDSPRDQYELWRDDAFEEMDLLHAHLKDQVCSRHFHNTYFIGLYEEGLELGDVGDQQVEFDEGAISLVNPGQVHAGKPGQEAGFRYRAIYPPEELLIDVTSEIADRPAGPPRFPTPKIYDPELAEQFRNFHVISGKNDVARLQKETVFVELMKILITRYADGINERPVDTSLSEPVEVCKDYLHAYYDQEISLEELADVTGRSRYHLCRIFREQVGLPPYEYLTNLRVHQAMKLLREGEVPAKVALRVGFYDQSHLTNHFRDRVGIPPGAYRRQC